MGGMMGGGSNKAMAMQQAQQQQIANQQMQQQQIAQAKADQRAAEQAAEFSKQTALLAQQNEDAKADREFQKQQYADQQKRLDEQSADSKASMAALQAQMAEKSKPIEAPDTNSPLVQEQKAGTVAALTQRSGRRSTILTNPETRPVSDTQDDYGRPKLGAAARLGTRG